MRRTIHTARWLLAERISIVACSTITQLIIARTLGATSYGYLSSLLAMTAMLLPIAQGGVAGILVKALVENSDEEESILRTALWWRLCAAGASVAIGLIAWKVSTPVNTINNAFPLLLVAQAALAMQVVEFRFLAHSDVHSIVIARLTVTVTLAIVKIYLALTNPTVMPLAYAFAAEFLCLGAAYGIMAKRAYGSLPIPRRDQRWIENFSVRAPWLTVAGIAEVANQKLDVVMIERMRGAADAGIYSAAAKISEAWYAIPALLTAATLPQLVERKLLGKNGPADWQTMLDGMFALTLVVSLTMSAIATSITETLFGPEFNSSTNVLTIHIWAGLFVGMRAVASRWIISEDFVWLSTWTALTGALSNIIFNWILIPLYGTQGAAVATVISYATAGWLSMFAWPESRQLAFMMGKSLLLPIRPRAVANLITLINRYRAYD